MFQQRIATLERLLREANALATGTATTSADSQPEPPDLDTAVVPALSQTAAAGSVARESNGGERRGESAPNDDEEPDGGMPIRDHAGPNDPTHELKKVSEVRARLFLFRVARPKQLLDKLLTTEPPGTPDHHGDGMDSPSSSRSSKDVLYGSRCRSRSW